MSRLEQVQAKARAASLLKEYEKYVQQLLDSTARERGYDSIISLISYKGSTNTKWDAEATVGLKWRDDCWNESLVQMGTYLATGVQPTKEEFLAAMPTPNWPE